jgi:hypothetical protein
MRSLVIVPPNPVNLKLFSRSGENYCRIGQTTVAGAKALIMSLGKTLSKRSGFMVSLGFAMLPARACHINA